MHRVFIDVVTVIKCGSCGEVLPDLEAAKRHIMAGGPKTLVEVPTPYPCPENGCERAFSSEQGLNVHRARAHKQG